MQELFLEKLNINSIETLIVLVSILILSNLVVSVLESIKLKNFNFKKLPGFIGDWFICTLAFIFVEVLIAISPENIVNMILLGVKDIMIVSTVCCYLKKLFESLKGLGWDIDIDALENFINKKQ